MYIAQTHLWLSSLLRHVSVADGAKSQQNHWTSSNLWGDFNQCCHKGPGGGDFPGNDEHDPLATLRRNISKIKHKELFGCSVSHLLAAYTQQLKNLVTALLLHGTIHPLFKGLMYHK